MATQITCDKCGKTIDGCDGKSFIAKMKYTTNYPFEGDLLTSGAPEIFFDLCPLCRREIIPTLQDDLLNTIIRPTGPEPETAKTASGIGRLMETPEGRAAKSEYKKYGEKMFKRGVEAVAVSQEIMDIISHHLGEEGNVETVKDVIKRLSDYYDRCHGKSTIHHGDKGLPLDDTDSSSNSQSSTERPESPTRVDGLVYRKLTVTVKDLLSGNSVQEEIYMVPNRGNETIGTRFVYEQCIALLNEGRANYRLLPLGDTNSPKPPVCKSEVQVPSDPESTQIGVEMYAKLGIPAQKYSPPSFNAGDIVVCVDDSNPILKYGEAYLVLSVNAVGVAVRGVSNRWSPSHFQLAKNQNQNP